MYSMEERSPDAGWKPFGNEGEIRMDYIWDHWVPLGDATGW